MTDILCKWLNNEVQISEKIDPTNFAREFSTGYLVGEVLSAYQLQEDFNQFSKSKNADSRLNNLMRVEPVLHLLGVPFDTNIARDLMTEKHGVATRLMYQLFIALNKKQKSNLTGVAMETMRPAAPAKLENVESMIYKERLKHMTPRQTDLDLDSLMDRYHKKQLEMEQVAFKERFEEEEHYIRRIQEQRQGLIQKYKETQAKKSDMLAKIQAAAVHLPKPPANKTAKAIAQRRETKRQQDYEEMKEDIDAFETKLMRTLPPSKPMGDSAEVEEVEHLPDTLEHTKQPSNSEYIGKIRKRLNEDQSARAEREKRRRKVLVDQLKAHEAQEEARREEMLVNRLMKQSQQERRIAVQLLQARHEKDVIRKNRLLREKQYEDRRLREFEEALNRESEMARLAKLEYDEQTRQDRDMHDQIMAERALEKYQKHYDMCSEVLSDVLDFSTKVGEYRDLTNRLLPPKLMRDWTTLFTEGKPLYEPCDTVVADSSEPTPEQVLEEERQKLLDEGDFNEYKQMMGEWIPPDGSEVSGPPRDNPIMGHIVERLFNVVHPPSPPPTAPEFPPFPIKACVMGKVFSGKSSTCKALAENHRLEILSVEDLVHEAVQAHRNGECIEPEDEDDVLLPGVSADDVDQLSVSGGQGSVTHVPSEDGGLGAGPSPAPMDTESQQEARRSEDSQRNGKASAEAAISKSASPATVDNREKEEGRQTADKQDDGSEKTDAEKPVPDEDVQSHVNPMATPRAILGQRAMKLLKKGCAVDDSLSTEILVEAIKRIPEGTGWIIDGYPSSYAQAKLLEKALSGFDTGPSREPSKVNLKGKKGKSVLAPDPKPAPAPPEPSSGINVVILFDVSNELCLKRSAGRTYASQADEQYQQEFKPPPEGSATGIGKQEKVIEVEDPSHDQEQIHHRITTFQDAWPKLEKWFTRFGSLKRVDAMQSAETVYLEVENVLEEAMRKVAGLDQEESPPIETTETKPVEEAKPVEPEKPPEPPTEPAEEDRSRPSSRKSRTGSGKRSGSRGSTEKKKDGKSSGRAGSKTGDKKAGKGSRGNSPKSPKRSKSSAKKSKTPEPEPEPVEHKEPEGPPPPKPGSDEWVYVDQPIDDELAHVLCPHWEVVETTYLSNSKQIFRKVRQEREMIIRYLFQIRKDYQDYLRRPDHKQEFISQWQKDFNEVPDDIREDEETRAELHQRVDDVRERLWSICDERKEAAEKEQEGIVTDGWVDDRLGVLSNHYISLIQVEVDRFQESVRLLKDYYKGMEGRIPDELASEYIRIPLVELPVTERPASAAGSDGGASDAEAGRLATPSQDEARVSVSKMSSSSAKKRKGEEEPNDSEEKKSRIPLVPRRPTSPDAAGGAAKGKPEKGKGKPGGKDAEEMPTPPQDPDERLIFEAHWMAAQAVDKVSSHIQKLAAEQAAKEAEEEAERQREMEKELEKQKVAASNKKGGKGGKGGGGKKSRSPSPKKGKEKASPTQPTPPPVEEVSEEEKEKKKTKDKARQEFFASVQEEVEACKVRMELVKLVSFGILQHLKGKSEGAYKDMNDWLGARFLKEMESIDHISEIMRFAIENATKIKEELKLQQEDFLISEDVKVLRSPSPVPRPLPSEDVMTDMFTVSQIMAIYKQFRLTAPSGMLSLKAFQEIFQDLTSLTHGTEQVPDQWLSLSADKLELISLQLSADTEYIDWRALLLQVAQPWPSPSQSQLLDTLARFTEMDQGQSGTVTREQFERVELWFGESPKPPTPDDLQEPFPFDRLGHLKVGFFDIFADHSVDPAQLDYVSMLLYFSIATDAYEGFLRALSVSAGTHMPRLPNKRIAIKKPSRPPSQASLAVSVDLEAEKVQEEEPSPEEDIPEWAVEAVVPIDSLDRVLHHGQNMRGDSHRFSVTTDPEDAFSRERLAGVYQELGSDNLEAVPFSVLIEHPIVQDMVAMCHTYRAIDMKALLANSAATALDNTDAQSIKIPE